MSSIGAQLRAISKKSMVKAEKIIKETYFDIGNDVIIGTPVLDGFLIANWNVGYDYDISTTDSQDQNKSSGRLKEVISTLDIGKTFYFMNSLPYADRIENEGWSENAPEGMVKKSVVKFETIAQSKINKYC